MAADKTAVIVRPRHPDDPTEFSYTWAETVKQAFIAGGWEVRDLAIDDAVRAEAERAVSGNSVFVFYGHGLPAQMIGQDDNPLIDRDNLELLKRQTVYVMACQTALQLGKEAENIAQCYLGYTDEVIIWYDYPDCLGECVNKGILEMLRSSDCTIAQAQQHITNEYNRWIDYFAYGEGANFQLAADLRHNRKSLRLIGDGSARLCAF